MKRVTSRSWTSEQESLLLSLVEKGASAARASAALNRPRNAVQNRARQLGKPFQDVRMVKAARLSREAGALDALQTIGQLADSSHTQSG
jgi:hypothetical protein